MAMILKDVYVAHNETILKGNKENQNDIQQYSCLCYPGTLAEWLRRGPAKAVCNACESSNLSGVDKYLFFLFASGTSRNIQMIKLFSNNIRRTLPKLEFEKL